MAHTDNDEGNSCDLFEGDDENEDLKSEISRSAHAGMLHDNERHRKYNEALIAIIKEINKNSKKKRISVLDIGTGTGILSMMAAKAAENVEVTACEMFEPMSELAREIIRDNGLEEKIKVSTKSSTDLKIGEDIPEKVDVLVSEIVDSELIGEGILPTLFDAHQRLLSPGARVIPASARMYVQLIESPTLWKMHKLDLKKLNLDTPKLFQNCKGITSCHELQINEFYPRHLKLLSEPNCIKSFDFETLTTKEKVFSNECSITITSTGTIHGILMWWDLTLHERESIILSMSPSWITEDSCWRDHWMQCVYYLPTSLDVQVDEKVTATMFHDDYSIWFDVGKTTSSLSPMCDCGLHFSWSREMFALWNDPNIISDWKMFTENYLSEMRSILVIGETSPLPVILKSFSSSLNVSYLDYSERSRDIVRQISHENEIEYKMFQSDENQNFDAVLIDPYWSSNIFPWEFLKVWSIVKEHKLDINDVYPTSVDLRAVFVELEDLWQVKKPVKEIHGFDLKRFDSLMEEVRKPHCNENFLYAHPYSMVEYKNVVISDIVTLATFKISEELPSVEHTYRKNIHLWEPVTKKTALVVWVDFNFSDNLVFTSGRSTKDSEWVRYCRQGVVFLPENDKKHLGSELTVPCSVLYCPLRNENEMLFSFSN